MFFNNTTIDSIVLLSLGYFVGYFINSIGSLLERIYNSVVGLPSDDLLILKSNQDWTGCKKVRFYEAPRVIELLKKELKDPNASNKKNVWMCNEKNKWVQRKQSSNF